MVNIHFYYVLNYCKWVIMSNFSHKGLFPAKNSVNAHECIMLAARYRGR